MATTGEAAASEAVARSCLDCGTVLLGPRCHHCGQPAHAHRSVGHFVEEAVHGVLHADGKLWRTVPLLLFRPGKLTRDYVHGRRTRYVGPIGIFLLAVLLTVVMLGFASNAPNTVGRHSVVVVEVGRAIDWVIASADAAHTRAIEAVVPPERVRAAQTDRVYYDYKVRSLMSKLSVLIVPLALPLLWLLFCWRRDVRLYDHAVFLLYELSVLSVLVGLVRLTRVPAVEVALLCLTVLPFLHLTAGFKEAYLLSWPGAIVRTALLIAGLIVTFWAFHLSVVLIVLSE